MENLQLSNELQERAAKLYAKSVTAKRNGEEKLSAELDRQAKSLIDAASILEINNDIILY